MTSDSLARFMHHVRSMRQLTNVELVNTYWEQAHQIAKTGRLGFIIRGNLSWESKHSQGVSGSSDIWLKSNRYEPIGKHIAEEPVRTYLQWYMNIYEIWGTLAIRIDPNDASTSKLLIGQTLEKVTCVSNTMSFLCGASVRWFPASYAWVRHESMSPPPEQAITESWDCIQLQRSQDESTSIIINDEYVTNQFFPFIDRIEAMPLVIQTVINTAMDWHAQANRHASGLNRFVNYWESIELLGNFFYPKLPTGIVGRKSKKEKKNEIMHLLQKGVTQGNCMDLVKRCDEILEPVARVKIIGFLRCIVHTAVDLQRIENSLFSRNVKMRKSLKDIRDDIAHGEISSHDFETLAELSPRLADAQRISKEVILRSIMCAEELTHQLAKGKTTNQE